MNKEISPEQLMKEVEVFHSDMLSNWGASWKTDLLGRLIVPRMIDAWAEIARRSKPRDLESAGDFVPVPALCFEFIDIGQDALEPHSTPKEKSERFDNISKQAAWLATAIGETKLNRFADPYLIVEQGRPTPTISTLLEELSSEAKELAEVTSNAPSILRRPGSGQSTRTYVIRRLAVLFNRFYGGNLQRTLASFAGAILGDETEVTIPHVNSALQNWKPVEFDGRGEY